MSPPVKKILSKEEQLAAINDRKSGYSYPEITRKYGISNRKARELLINTDISPEYKDIWISKRGGSKKSAALRKQYIKQDVENYYVDSMCFTEREKLFLLLALYWGEGAKREFSMANSDPRMIKLFLDILLELFKLPKQRISVSIRIFEDMDALACKQYWENLLDLPIYQVYILKGKKTGKLPVGMCRLRLKSGTNILNTLKAHIEYITDSYAPIAQQDRAMDS